MKNDQRTFSIILVDDEPWALIGLQELLDWNQLGFRIVAACDSGHTALSEALRLRPDAIVTDIRMPDMTGLELISALKKELPDLQSIIVSAYSDFDVAREAIRLAALDYVLKPLSRTDMISAAEAMYDKLSDIHFRKSEDLSAISETDAVPVIPANALFGGTNFLVLSEVPFAHMECLQEIRHSSSFRYKNYYCMITDQEPAIASGLGVSPSFARKDIPEDVFEQAEASLLCHFRFAPSRPGDKSRISVSEIQMYLYRNLGNDLSLRIIAGHFYITETYLCDIFKKETGTTVLLFLRHIRMEHARRLLTETSFSLVEIAELCGYRDYSYFSKQFKAVWGVTPGEYRQ